MKLKSKAMGDSKSERTQKKNRSSVNRNSEKETKLGKSKNSQNALRQKKKSKTGGVSQTNSLNNNWKKEKKIKDLDFEKGMKVKKKKEKSEAAPEKDSDSVSDEDVESDLEDDMTSHKQQLKKLKETDPDFYKYLEENDENLLDFNDSDEDSEQDGEEGDDGKYHKPPQSLEVASDESDFEPDEDGPSIGKAVRDDLITLKMITKWQQNLQKDKTSNTLEEVVEAFHAALLRVSAEGEQTAPSKYKVDGSSVFNAIVRMCVMDLPSALRLILKIPKGTNTPPKQSKSWGKTRTILTSYFTDLSELCSVTSPSMLSVLLKHVHQMVPYIVYFPRIAKRILKRLIELWSSNEDVVRVLAFLCILRIANQRRVFLSSIVKVMYLTYVRNTKFVSPTTLPAINFMRQCLAEMLALDDTVSYHHAFLYIRQLAIHLRNAVTLKKKESYQSVYNWQFISSLHLWAELLGLVPYGSPLHSLIYPLVQIIIGTIKLIPSSQYFPLRFHCCKILIAMADKNGVFIPVLPFLLEVLRDFDFNRKHKTVSMKPLDLTCLLRCSKSQMMENGFKDAVIENVFNLLLEYLATECYRISFPDTLVPAVIQMKEFLKTCKVVNYCKKIKTVLDKVLENSKYIEAERKKLTIKLDDSKGVEAHEESIRINGTPLLTFYNSWKKVHLQQQAKKVTDNVAIGDFKLPVIYKFDKKRSRDDARSAGPTELFPSDDEDEADALFDDDESDNEPKPKKQKKKAEPAKEKQSKKQVKAVEKPEEVYDDDTEDDADEDIVQDLNLSDLE